MKHQVLPIASHLNNRVHFHIHEASFRPRFLWLALYLKIPGAGATWELHKHRPVPSLSCYLHQGRNVHKGLTLVPFISARIVVHAAWCMQILSALKSAFGFAYVKWFYVQIWTTKSTSLRAWKLAHICNPNTCKFAHAQMEGMFWKPGPEYIHHVAGKA